MPRLLRGIFRKRRELLLDLAQCAAEAVAEYVRRGVGAGTRPGIVVSIATSGDLVQWHPHGHLLLTDGGFSDDGTFHPLTDELSITRILDHVGLSPPPPEKPPPTRELIRVPVDEEARELQAG